MNNIDKIFLFFITVLLIVNIELLGRSNKKAFEASTLLFNIIKLHEERLVKLEEPHH